MSRGGGEWTDGSCFALPVMMDAHDAYRSYHKADQSLIVEPGGYRRSQISHDLLRAVIRQPAHQWCARLREFEDRWLCWPRDGDLGH